MTIIEYQINTFRKCISCEYYEYKEDYWLNGTCICNTNKIKNRNRNYNSKACIEYAWKKNIFKEKEDEKILEK